ncbi:MAG: glyoxalase [Lachnospiraceae bacterium]|nr:glyoxalase [Lachnospiraceae bacterium]
MKLKNILIAVNNIEAAKQFYGRVFGLIPILEAEGNIVLTEGLVLQEKCIWESELGKGCTFKNHCSELYFEERNIEEFVEKLEEYYPETEYVTVLTVCDKGQKLVRFYDLDGNLIEVRTPREAAGL